MPHHRKPVNGRLKSDYANVNEYEVSDPPKVPFALTPYSLGESYHLAVIHFFEIRSPFKWRFSSPPIHVFPPFPVGLVAAHFAVQIGVHEFSGVLGLSLSSLSNPHKFISVPLFDPLAELFRG